LFTGLGHAILGFVVLALFFGDPAGSQFKTVGLVLLFWLGFVLIGGVGDILDTTLLPRLMGD